MKRYMTLLCFSWATLSMAMYEKYDKKVSPWAVVLYWLKNNPSDYSDVFINPKRHVANYKAQGYLALGSPLKKICVKAISDELKRTYVLPTSLYCNVLSKNYLHPRFTLQPRKFDGALRYAMAYVKSDTTMDSIAVKETPASALFHIDGPNKDNYSVWVTQPHTDRRQVGVLYEHKSVENKVYVEYTLLTEQADVEIVGSVLPVLTDVQATCAVDPYNNHFISSFIRCNNRTGEHTTYMEWGTEQSLDSPIAINSAISDNKDALAYFIKLSFIPTLSSKVRSIALGLDAYGQLWRIEKSHTKEDETRPFCFFKEKKMDGILDFATNITYPWLIAFIKRDIDGDNTIPTQGLYIGDLITKKYVLLKALTQSYWVNDLIYEKKGAYKNFLEVPITMDKLAHFERFKPMLYWESDGSALHITKGLAQKVKRDFIMLQLDLHYVDDNSNA